MTIRVPSSGPENARIMVVGEAPGAEEERLGTPFVGASGAELTRMLAAAGISRAECFITNLCKHRPPANDIEAWIPKSKKAQSEFTSQLHGVRVHPHIVSGFDELTREISIVRPRIIIALGGSSLWALCANRGIMAWRGSLLFPSIGGVNYRVVPTIHPAAILRQWDLRAIAIHDLKRAAREAAKDTYDPPNHSFILRPSFEVAQEVLARLQDEPKIAVDIETGAGQISCIGFAWNAESAICIPFRAESAQTHYWTLDQEVEIVAAIVRLLRRPDIEFVGQNFLYDAQYLAKQWGVVPRRVRDTMLLQHCLLPGLPKSLAFISSLHCANHVYWKDEGKSKEKGWSPEVFWGYNCKDAVATFEAAESLGAAIEGAGLQGPADFQTGLFHPVLRIMLRGIRVDIARRAQLKVDLEAAIAARLAWLERVAGHPLNPRSPKQLMAFFYHDLGIAPAKNRKSGNATLDDEALKRIAIKEPLWRQIIQAIQELRSLGVFLSTFIEAPLDSDGRMRCSFNIAGAETFRFSSSENAFGSGLNLQTIPKGNKLAGANGS